MPYEYLCMKCPNNPPSNPGALVVRTNKVDHLVELVQFHYKQEHAVTPTREEILSSVMVLEPYKKVPA